MIRDCRRHYGELALRFGDAATRRWLARNTNPYRHEIAEVARRIVVPGAYLLNLSYEWSCTAGVGPDPEGDGARLMRTLDWPVDGLGRSVVVTRRETQAGALVDVTWPGFVGVLTAMAPGRFAAAINQPPFRKYTRSCWFDWVIARRGVWNRSELPPAHVLRQVFETCRTYGEAKAMLTEAPLCVPAFFTLAGTRADEACAIERTERQAAVHEAPASISNHWLRFDLPARDRGTDSLGRLAQMQDCVVRAGNGLGWVTPPIRNWKTRLAVFANAATGDLQVQGWESDGPATRVFNLREAFHGERRKTRPAPEPEAKA